MLNIRMPIVQNKDKLEEEVIKYQNYVKDIY